MHLEFRLLPSLHTHKFEVVDTTVSVAPIKIGMISHHNIFIPAGAGTSGLSVEDMRLITDFIEKQKTSHEHVEV